MTARIRTLLLVVLGAGLMAFPAASSAKAPPRYYLALGDSLSRGQQPDVSGITRNTAEGYTDQLFAIERRRVRNLRLVKLGCGGETTGSMITGRGNERLARFFHCPHPAGGSQLAAAVRFLRAHHRRGEVPLLTIDIGANDIDGCPSAPNLGQCVSNGINAINHDVPIILSRLRRAAPRGTTFVGMTIYDPVLGGYFSASASTRALAAGSPGILKTINDDLTKADTNARFRTADVARAFNSYDGTDTVSWMGNQIPVNVARVCAWTWACTTPPAGPNIHANKNGYAVMAATFARVIGRLR